MPLYEYICEKCGAHFELRGRARAAPQTIYCPRCESATVARVLDLCHRWHAEWRDRPRLRAGGLRHHPPAAVSRAPSRLIDAARE
jgi:putative FmdB family regulatory protein